MITRRSFLAALATTAVQPHRALHAQNRPTIDVRKLGASGDGKSSDLWPIAQAVDAARKKPAGATIYFPPGEYSLGTAENTALIAAKDLQNVRFVGEKATISCRTRDGDPNMIAFSAARGIRIEGLTFRDYGLDRPNRSGAHALAFVKDSQAVGCRDIEVSDCRFESVLSGIVCYGDDDRAKLSGFRLTNLSVSRSYYGFNFADAGDDVVGRGLRCDDVQRSYFPYGVSNHDIELDTRNNATGFTDVLIKCIHKDTFNFRVKVKCRAKRGGDAIVALDHQHAQGRGTIRNIDLDLDIDDVDCRLHSAILIRSLDAGFHRETRTTNRWDDIAIEGDIRICARTKLLAVETVGVAPGTLRIGRRLAANARLPANIPGFVVEARK